LSSEDPIDYCIFQYIKVMLAVLHATANRGWWVYKKLVS
jgi:hypothetical protein